MDAHMYSRRISYKGLLDTEECQLNQTSDSNHCTESIQIDSTSEPKYNKRIKTLIGNIHSNCDNKMLSTQIGQQSTLFEQNLDTTMSTTQFFCEKSEFEMKSLNKKGTNTNIGTKNIEVNNLVQHFNDHSQTQAIAEVYSQHNENPKHLMATYSPNLNEQLSSNEKREHSFGNICQNDEHK